MADENLVSTSSCTLAVAADVAVLMSRPFAPSAVLPPSTYTWKLHYKKKMAAFCAVHEVSATDVTRTVFAFILAANTGRREIGLATWAEGWFQGFRTAWAQFEPEMRLADAVTAWRVSNHSACNNTEDMQDFLQWLRLPAFGDAHANRKRFERPTSEALALLSGMISCAVA